MTPKPEGAATFAPPRPRGSDSSPAFDMSLPDNRRKLEATESLGTLADEAGLSIIELASAFVVNHLRDVGAVVPVGSERQGTPGRVGAAATKWRRSRTAEGACRAGSASESRGSAATAARSTPSR
jgi:hypothetical protein